MENSISDADVLNQINDAIDRCRLRGAPTDQGSVFVLLHSEELAALASGLHSDAEPRLVALSFDLARLAELPLLAPDVVGNLSEDEVDLHPVLRDQFTGALTRYAIRHAAGADVRDSRLVILTVTEVGLLTRWINQGESDLLSGLYAELDGIAQAYAQPGGQTA